VKWRLLPLAVCLLAASVQAQGLFGDRAEPEEMPSRFVRFDAADLGAVAFPGRLSYPLICGALLKATCQWNRCRLGVAMAEAGVDPSDGTLGPAPVNMTVPVYVGYDIWHNPKRTWIFYGAAPALYAEVGASFVYLVTIKTALACEVDYYGLGLRAEAGTYWMPGQDCLPFVSAQVRLLTFSTGF
jgi:hypothetical protein